VQRLLFRLALKLGYPHPRYLAPLLSAQDLTEWAAFERLEPFGDHFHELMHGINTAAVVNAARHAKPGTPPAEPDDFMPTELRQKQEYGMSPAAIRANLQTWKAMVRT
jgi:hypothetical protein